MRSVPHASRTKAPADVIRAPIHDATPPTSPVSAASKPTGPPVTSAASELRTVAGVVLGSTWSPARQRAITRASGWG